MTKMPEFIKRLPSPPRGVSFNYNEEKEALHLRMRATPFGIKALLLNFWLLVSCLVLTVLVKELIIFARWIGSHWTIPDWALMCIYFSEFLFIMLFLSFIFLLFGRSFKVKLVISKDQLQIHGLRKRRWCIDGLSSVRLVSDRAIIPLGKKRKIVQEQNELNVDEWALSKEELNWCNMLLVNFIEMNQNTQKIS